MTGMHVDINKYQAVLQYFLQTLGNEEGKQKARLLLYFLDFAFYEAYETSFTGETYVASPNGPHPLHFDKLIQALPNEVSFQDIVWTAQERAMLEHVVTTYGTFSVQELEQLSCREAPYCAVDLQEVIPYEYSWYRGTVENC